MTTRVLCYSPYDLWTLHGLWEKTILHALRVRGAEVRIAACDGLYSDCDVFWAATQPRDQLSCTRCQAHVAGLAAGFGLPFRWLGRWLLPEEVREAERFAAGLAPDQLLDACYSSWPVGRWVESSVHSHLRRSHLDPADPEVVEALRSWVGSGLVACFALQRLIDDVRPDVLLVFSGRLSSTRIAFELARERSVRVVCHERGLRPETLRIFVDERCTSLAGLRAAWDAWRDVPLIPDERDRVLAHMSARSEGRELGWKAFSPPAGEPAEVRAQLSLRTDRPVFALFTSSDDEGIAEEDFQSCFPDQMDWVRQTLDFAGAHPELDLVVRVHPNTAGKFATGDNLTQLGALRALAPHVPGNVRFVWPEDPISSYTLMELADVALTYRSTVALEMACVGKPALVAAGCAVHGLEFVRTVRSPASYRADLEELHPAVRRFDAGAVRAAALRFAYLLFFRWTVPFPLVRMPDPHSGELAWSTVDALRPGRDSGLDRVCRAVLEGVPPWHP